jgi:hypothetical protein
MELQRADETLPRNPSAKAALFKKHPSSFASRPFFVS